MGTNQEPSIYEGTCLVPRPGRSTWLEELKKLESKHFQKFNFFTLLAELWPTIL